jgi:hypothetical protein
MDIVKEKARPLTQARIDLMRKRHKEWWEASHGENERAYQRAKSDLYTLISEFTPELLDLAEKQLRWKD